MNVAGRETTTRQVMIEVDKDDLIRQLEMLVVKRCPTLKADSYVSDGNLYVYSYTHPHNNDDVYEKARPATQEEIEWMKWMDTLRMLLKH